MSAVETTQQVALPAMPRKNARKTSPPARTRSGKAGAQLQACHAPNLATQRRYLAYEAARIMDENQSPEFEHARRKAAERLGIANRRLWPSNEEIQALLLEQQRLFGGRAHAREHRELLRQALAAMTLLEDFEPRLIGAAWAGTATLDQGLDMQLFAESPEDVIWTLIDHRIPWREDERPFRYADGARVTHPIVRFLAGGVPIRLIVLPHKAKRNPPLDPVSNRPERGAARLDVERHLQETTAGDDREGSSSQRLDPEVVAT